MKKLLAYAAVALFGAGVYFTPHTPPPVDEEAAGLVRNMLASGAVISFDRHKVQVGERFTSYVEDTQNYVLEAVHRAGGLKSEDRLLVLNEKGALIGSYRPDRFTGWSAPTVAH